MATSAPSQIHTRLRVFLAVAHHLSFTRAGEELSITTGAVSQQIKLLEDWLGQRLFRRLPRRLELTDAGKRLLTAVDPAYAAVELAIGRLRGGALSGVVRVRTLNALNLTLPYRTYANVACFGAVVGSFCLAGCGIDCGPWRPGYRAMPPMPERCRAGTRRGWA